MEKPTREDWLCSLLNEPRYDRRYVSEEVLKLNAEILQGYKGSSDCFAIQTVLDIYKSGVIPSFKNRDKYKHEMPPATRPDLLEACILLSQQKRPAGENTSLALTLLNEPNLAAMPKLRKCIVDQAVLFDGPKNSKLFREFCCKLGTMLPVFAVEVGNALRVNTWKLKTGLLGLIEVVQNHFDELSDEQKIKLTDCLSEYVYFPAMLLAETICVSATAENAGGIISALVSALRYDEQVVAAHLEKVTNLAEFHTAAVEMKKNADRVIATVMARFDAEALGKFVEEVSAGFAGRSILAWSEVDFNTVYDRMGKLIAKRIGVDGAYFAPFVAAPATRVRPYPQNALLVMPIVNALGPDNVRDQFQAWLSAYDLPKENARHADHTPKAIRKRLMYEFVIPYGFYGGSLVQGCLGKMIAQGYKLSEMDLRRYLPTWIGSGPKTEFYPNREVWEDPVWRKKILHIGANDGGDPRISHAATGWLLSTAFCIADPANMEQSLAWLASMLPNWQEIPGKIRCRIIASTSGFHEEELARRFVAANLAELSKDERMWAQNAATPAHHRTTLIERDSEYIELVFGKDVLAILFSIQPRTGSLYLGSPSDLGRLFKDEQSQNRLLGFLEQHGDRMDLHLLYNWTSRYDLAKKSAQIRRILRRKMAAGGMEYYLQQNLIKMLEPFNATGG